MMKGYWALWVFLGALATFEKVLGLTALRISKTLGA